MLSFDIGGVRFDLRAAAVIAEGDWVLLHRLEGDAMWSLPGGRVEPGEAAAMTVARELMEEMGQAVEVSGLLFVIENFFEDAKGSHHEVGLYYATSLPAASSYREMSRSHEGDEGGEKLEFRWFRRRELEQLELQPPCLRQLLSQAEPGFMHVVQRGEASHT